MEKIIIASGPVIVEDNKALLDISSGDDFWKFCGGKVKENESLIMAAQRRAKEELGIDIEIINPEPFFMHVKKPGDENIDVVLVHWLAKRIGEPTPGQEVEKFDWLDVNALPENIGPTVKPALRHFGFIK